MAKFTVVATSVTTFTLDTESDQDYKDYWSENALEGTHINDPEFILEYYEDMIREQEFELDEPEIAVKEYSPPVGGQE